MNLHVSNFALHDLFYVCFIVWSLSRKEVAEGVLKEGGATGEGTDDLASN